MVDLIPTKKGIYIRDGGHTYCVKPPFFSLRNYRNLKNRSLIIGYVGARGSGKSVGAARTVILDYMLPGKTVWSNMKIGFNLVSNGNIIPMESKSLERLSLVELDEVYSNGLIYVDEVNLLAEARRAMSQENLMFSYILQQLRKRRLTIIWSAQSELHCDDRLRWQTDIFIICEDISIARPKCGIGELSLWKAHDFSGIVKGITPHSSGEAMFYQGVQWNKPWWNTYNTWELQDVEVKVKSNPAHEEDKRIATEIAEYMKGNSVVKKRYFWKRYGVTDINRMAAIGRILSLQYGVVSSINRRDYILEEDYEEGAIA